MATTTMSTETTVLVAVGSVIFILVMVMCCLGAFYFKRVTKRNEQVHQVLNLLSGDRTTATDTDESYKSYLSKNTLAFIERSPFTKIIPVSDIKISMSQVLGEGHYGIVYAGYLRGVAIAVKALKSGFSDDLYLEFIREVKVMEYVGHNDHIVEFHGAEISRASRGKVFVALELSPYGNLQNYLRTTSYKEKLGITTQSARGGSTRYVNVSPSGLVEMHYLNEVNGRDEDIADVLSWVQVMCSWAGQIASGMAFLEHKGVFHGDLATRNVLVFENDVVKISDFGYSRNIYQYNTYVKKKTVPLPWRWSAIETLERLEFSSKADVWAYGVTLWEIFSFGNLPFPKNDWDEAFLDQLNQGMRLHKPEVAPQELFDRIMMPAWNLDPDERPTFAEICDMLESLKKSDVVKIM